jgi:Lrp/AsnC family leucine-responsive transcriptional regulator
LRKSAAGEPFDAIDRRVLAILQDDCKTPLTKIGEKVGLSAPALVERIRKLERAGIIRGYYAVLDGRKLGLDLTAFIGISMNYLKMIESFERSVAKLPELLECHHVTGAHSLLLKVKTFNTQSLEQLISRIRSIEGVQRTDTMVVFSTRTERTQLPVDLRDESDGERRSQADGEKTRSRRKARG